jgi:serine protease Do
MNIFRIFSLFLIIILGCGSAKASNFDASRGFADMVEKLTPAVVNISTTKEIEIQDFSSAGPDVPPGHPLEGLNDLFKNFKMPQGSEKAQSLGSGFIIDADGYVVTNNHVIEGADQITVTLSDDSQYKAEVVGIDNKTDLALLKVTPKKALPFVTFGDSNRSRVGDYVIVIGNPFGLGGTVTSGIVSARARDINAGPFDDFIQTDAAINRGNSGGPMFNTDGEVIGINTVIFTPNGVGNVGIGFAVSSNLAKPVIEQLKENGTVERGWLGVKIQTLSKQLAESMGLETTQGALVADVIKGSPADKAGIKLGDVIIQFNGQNIATMRRLPRIVAETPIGKAVEAIIIRDGKKLSTSVKIEKLDETKEKDSFDDKQPSNKQNLKGDKALGLSLAPLTPELRRRYGLSGDTSGMIVLGIEPKSDAADQGVKEGDVIVSVNQKDIPDIDELKKIIAESKKSGKASVLALISRNNERLFIGIPISDKE